MEEFNKVKDEIVKQYLKDPNLHKVKKKSIEILLKQIKEFYNNDLCKGYTPSKYTINKQKKIAKEYIISIFEQFADKTQPSFNIISSSLQKMDFKEIKLPIMNSSTEEDKAIELKNLKKVVLAIIAFENIDLLKTINDYADVEPSSSFYLCTFKLYDELKLFAESGIDERHYYDEINAIQKIVKEIQVFSSTKILLDRLPKHPAESIIDASYDENIQLDLINAIVKTLAYRSKGAYKKFPDAPRILLEKYQKNEQLSKEQITKREEEAQKNKTKDEEKLSKFIRKIQQEFKGQ